jgi:hypothetical protein
MPKPRKLTADDTARIGRLAGSRAAYLECARVSKHTGDQHLTLAWTDRLSAPVHAQRAVACYEAAEHFAGRASFVELELALTGAPVTWTEPAQPAEPDDVLELVAA